MTTTKTYDLLNRLTAIGSQPSVSGASAVSFAYQYNDANQRTRVTLADGSFWVYQYDNLGQVISGRRYWSDGTPVAGQQFGYGFDDIGNRTGTQAGGDAHGAGLRTASYSANSLNQITSRDIPGAVDIIGAATALATNVNVNSQMAYRRGEYYWKELSINNSSAAQWQSVTNRAVQNGTTNTVTGNVFLAKTPETLGYDRDGNLTNDGRWLLTWDAENRLIQIESQTSAPTASKRKVVFTYDYRGRMARRTEYNGGSGSYVITNDLKLLYDGYHCMAELNATNNALVRSYLWGLDLSGSLNGAGGVGGLLAINSTANGIHFFAYDGNGNVTALVKATDGSVSAHYEYDPFGQTIRATGTMATENAYRFSTKRTDDATDLVHYEFRVYRPSTGTWISRDPMREPGTRLDRSLWSVTDETAMILLRSRGRGKYEVRTLVAQPPRRPQEDYRFIGNGGPNTTDYLGLDILVPAGDCSNACERYRRAQIEDNDGWRRDGGVICCGGKKYACAWGADLVKNERARSIIRRCLLKHEETHFEQTKPCCNNGYMYGPEFLDGMPKIGECVAHHAEAACLSAAVTECGGDVECTESVREEWEYQWEMIDVYCR